MAMIPIGYYKDAKKSAETFREYKGTRYSFPGDYAKIESDGSIILLGRGSNCINSAGEKIYPEEVEEALKKDPLIFDCLVVPCTFQLFGIKHELSLLNCVFINWNILISFSKLNLNSFYKNFN